MKTERLKPLGYGRSKLEDRKKRNLIKIMLKLALNGKERLTHDLRKKMNFIKLCFLTKQKYCSSLICHDEENTKFNILSESPSINSL